MTKKEEGYIMNERMYRAAEVLNLAIKNHLVFTDKEWKQFGNLVVDYRKLTAFIGQLRRFK